VKLLLLIEYGSLLNACRERAGLSQEKLAELLHRSRSCISKFEKNKKIMDVDTFFRFLDVTNSKDVLYSIASGLDIVTITQQILQVAGMG
jgi:transcriptional regulator with XRE-family HTH domain